MRWMLIYPNLVRLCNVIRNEKIKPQGRYKLKTCDNGVNKMSTKSIEYVFGGLVTLDDITIEDMKSNKVWVNDLSGEYEDDFDETSIRPLLHADNVTKKMLESFVEVSILIKVKGTGVYGSANIDPEGNLEVISVWANKAWENIESVYSESEKIILINLVSIFNENDNEYEYSWGKDKAKRRK